jgi:succinate dehydrogenase / fumarate reductase cytochrome b subunit
MPEAALWGIRLGLGVIFLIHVWLTIQLKLENNAAREPYQFKNTIKATISSRYMIYTGLTVLVFLVFHLLQYTVRLGYNPADYTAVIGNGIETFDVYKMIVTGFSNVWVSGFYILAILMLFSHLRHGVQSIFQTVGLDSRKIRPVYNFIAIAYGAVICLGFISVPVSVLLGIIK